AGGRAVRRRPAGVPDRLDAGRGRAGGGPGRLRLLQGRLRLEHLGGALRRRAAGAAGDRPGTDERPRLARRRRRPGRHRGGVGARVEQAVRMLVEEVEKRSLVRWERPGKWPGDGTPVIAVGPADGVRRLLTEQGFQPPPDPAPRAAEGYRIAVGANPKGPAV